MYPNAKFIRTEIGKDKIFRQWPVLQNNAQKSNFRMKMCKIRDCNAKLWDFKIAFQFPLQIGKMERLESREFMISFYHRLYSIKVNSTNCSKWLGCWILSRNKVFGVVGSILVLHLHSQMRPDNFDAIDLMWISTAFTLASSASFSTNVTRTPLTSTS